MSCQNVSVQPSSSKEKHSLFTIQDTKGVKDKTDRLYVSMNLNGKQVSRSAVSIMAESKIS